MGDETQRRAIAGALGYAGRAYEDFLDIGRSLLNIAADDDVHTFFRAALCKSLRKTTFSQRADLARYCNLNVKRLHLIETGHEQASRQEQKILASALGYPGKKFSDFLKLGSQAMESGEFNRMRRKAPKLSSSRKNNIIKALDFIGDEGLVVVENTINALLNMRSAPIVQVKSLETGSPEE